MNYLGIRNTSRGIGDKVVFACLPENYYKSTGNKMVDLDNCWIFDNNPYVVRGVNPDLGVIDLWTFPWRTGFKSISERWCNGLDIKCFLRHPRLYIYENEIINYNRIVIHLTGKTFGTIQEKVFKKILENYPNFEICQIGHEKDKRFDCENKFGLSMLENAKLIASSGIFIGLNSGMMNIAKCYPRIRRKVIINNIDLNNFIPYQSSDAWIDFGWEYFNEEEYDIGVTNSYLKI